MKRHEFIENKGLEISNRFQNLDELRSYIRRLYRLAITDKDKKRATFLTELAIECQGRVIDRLHPKW